MAHDEKQIHIVRPGECMISLAARERLPLQKLLDANRELMSVRKDPGILLVGDEVVIPQRKLRTETCATGRRHRFVARQLRAEIRVRLVEFGQPRANETYSLVVDGEPVEGEDFVTDADGLAECPIPPHAKTVTIVIGEEEDEYELQLGTLDPIDAPSGIHGRLKNLGVYHGSVGAPLNGTSTRALSDLLRETPGQNLAPDARSETVRNALKEHYGS